MKRDSNQISRLILLMLVCLGFLAVGCSGPDTVEAIPRTNSNEPVFGGGKPLAMVERANRVDFNFVHEDHIACISINVQKLIGNSDLADVPWSLVEQQLASVIGPSNAILNKIERIWIVLDRSVASMEAMSENRSPVVFVVDFAEMVNAEELVAVNQKDDEQATKSVVTKIGANRIVIGDPLLTAKIGKTPVRSSLVRQLEQLELDADVDGLVDIKPIRNQFQTIFDSVAMFGGDAFTTYARLPDALQRVEMSLSLSSEEMLRAVAYIDDAELIKELANMATEGSQAGSPMTGGMPFSISGIAGGMTGRGGGRTPAIMIEPTSSNLFVEIGNEISEQDLFKITGNDKKLTLTLSRPAQIKELISALLYDGKRQMELAERTKHLKEIAVAMEGYVEKYDSFPPSGVVLTNAAEGLPAQFNWRVGLLPFLDQQDLYDRFDFSKPWDSPENMEVARSIPAVFAETSIEAIGIDSEAVSTKTRFHVIGGNLGLYLDDRIPKFSDISDKKIWTAVVVESAPIAAVEWTKPGSLVVGPTDLAKLGTDDENGVLFLNAAFDVRVITKDQDKVNGVLTPGGDEMLQRTDFLPLAF